MASVCMYFHVHQPYRVRKYKIFDIGSNSSYFDDSIDGRQSNIAVIKKVAQKCYLPTNALLLHLLEKYPEFHVSFSITGVILDQFMEYAPEVLISFQKLVKTGKVEIIGETYHHSLSFLFSKDEFKNQIKEHEKKIQIIFDTTPKVFRNTELIYNNDLANYISELGYTGILAEGADRILDWRSPNFIYNPPGNEKISILLKNYKLSDDIAFRFGEKSWSQWPLTAPKFAKWVNNINGNGNLVNLFMDYETFGEHQWESTGIFNFLESLPGEILSYKDNDFVTPSMAIKKYKSVGELDVPDFTSWADTERDLSAWMSNDIQKEASLKLYALRDKVIKSKDKKLINDWKKLTTSDHVYYMCTKWFNDGDVHKYFNPYDSPYEAFLYFMRVLSDLNRRVELI